MRGLASYFWKTEDPGGVDRLPAEMWMRTYSRRCGVNVTPHELRHTCPTFLLNAGAPVLTAQAILGHKYVGTILRYARLYDGTVVADYYRAMDEVKQHLALPEGTARPSPHTGQLLALVDSLQAGTLNGAQRESAHALRASLLSFAEQIAESVDKTGVQMGDGSSSTNLV
jgi:hypothetical protein